jgi:type I restriction enzyme M protein
MFVQSEKFVESHGGKLGDISIYGQESNATTRRLAIMNLAIRGIEADIGKEHADTFRHVQHPDLRADYVLANPPFNDSDWFRKDDDVRWQFGVPPKGNANFAWVQHFIHHLAPQGMAGFVLANGSMSSNQSGEGDIRKAIIEADLVDCMVALPGQLFYSTQIPVCLWFISRDKSGGKPSTRPAGHPSPTGRRDGDEGRLRDRRGETLFIDARKLGTLIDRVHRELTDADLEKITSTYHAWRGDSSTKNQEQGTKNKEQRTPQRPMPMWQASANPPPPPKSPRTATSSRPAATSVPRKSKTTATPSRKKCRASSPNCTPSSPSPRNWKPLSAPT